MRAVDNVQPRSTNSTSIYVLFLFWHAWPALVIGEGEAEEANFDGRKRLQASGMVASVQWICKAIKVKVDRGELVMHAAAVRERRVEI